MPRIRQCADLYAQRDFWSEINRRCPDVGVQSNNNAALARAVGTTDVTIRAYRQDPGKMQLKTLSRFVEALKPDPGVVLRLLGYSEQEIRAFARKAGGQ